MTLDEELEIVKTKIFLSPSSRFLGFILCNVKIEWDESIETACTEGTTIYFSPKFFKELTKEERVFVLLHELWHIGLLHVVRKENRDIDNWNKACDFYINGMLVKEGLTMPRGGLLDHYYDDRNEWVEEKIYEALPKKNKKNPWGHERIDKPSIEQQTEVINVVQKAIMQASLGSKAGSIPQSILTTLNKVLNPKKPWKEILRKHLTNYLDKEHSWKKPNKRFTSMYLPSHQPLNGRLNLIVLFFDVSSSVSEQDIQSFIGEASYIHRMLKPTELKIVQFNTQIVKEQTFKEFQKINSLDIHGRGGTSYECIKDWLNVNKPEVALVFTDLECYPMAKPTAKTDLYWIVPSTANSIYVKAGRKILLN